MEAPIQCPYKTNDKQCLKGWYMIRILTDDGEIIYECPEECKEIDFPEK